MTGGILGKLTAASAEEFSSVVVYDGQEHMLSVRAGPLRDELVALSKSLSKDLGGVKGSAMTKKVDEVEGKASSNNYFVDDLDGEKISRQQQAGHQGQDAKNHVHSSPDIPEWL